MKKYNKINSLYKRDERGRFIDEYSAPEFELLKDMNWIGTEKIDGTNIRIKVDEIGGRTDNAEIPKHLEPRLKEIQERLLSDSITLYGEGFGHKINKGGLYLGKECDFILFDVMVDDVFLKREDVNDIAIKLEIRSVPVLFVGKLEDAIDMVSAGFKSSIGDAVAEGLVLVPELDLRDRRCGRIITKLKTKDFRKI